MKKLHLPCLRGVLGDWTYYSTVMKIKDIVDHQRIITVPESKELYTKNINEILQREINSSRISKISKYLLNDSEHFFSSIIVAIHKGSPQWSDIDIEEKLVVDKLAIDDDSINFIENKFGILTLSGTEEIFALDGQHRLVGLREAYKKNKEIGEEEISLLYVIHNDKNIVRTRRLFTVLNRYAEKPKQAELIILEEDDVAAINARSVIMEHPVLSLKNGISSTRGGSILPNDNSFSTIVTVYNINKILYGKKIDFYRKRPSDQEIVNYYDKTNSFWNFFFQCFPYIKNYINGEKNIKNDNYQIQRNSETGGSLLLRPTGQELFAKVYKLFDNKNKLDYLKDNISKIDFNLSGKHFNYLFWNNGKILPKNMLLKYNLVLYLLGYYANEKKLFDDLHKLYESFNDELIIEDFK